MTTITRTIAGLGSSIAESVRAARAYETADTATARRAVLDRFVTEVGRHSAYDESHAAA
jgi:hypothetical protein